ncbi:DUF4928 family protein [Mesorhizobium sp. BR1-1-9]|uniref:DUF4928 family protein n=1 Tax=Mesorhizobium sp. BR1-1-9 TaxID=2876646 RepID=UPI001CD15095|nr:DUF4928 family protein [Mesorhizobium sp. BR1-1-9]MBZ9871590.1 DUF4928 family protein [Mesorhizobium sp. BR1-1-9]
MSPDQEQALNAFDLEHVGLSKGTLSFVLVITRRLQNTAFPANANDWRTANEGQVKGLGGPATRKILREHDVHRILSEEGGRTSRGNMGKLRVYVELLNELWEKNKLDLEAAEDFWVGKIQDYFDQQPFTFRLDPSKSMRSCVRHLLAQAIARQREVSGTMYAGAVMQHLIGAKLDIVRQSDVVHHGFSVADAPTNRAGDFLLGDVAIHVTAAPSEALMRKVTGNLSAGLRPIIITTEDGIGGAKALATQAAIEDRVDVIEIEQFVTSNVYEWSKFNRDSRPTTVGELIRRYNKIVSETESDPSLKIAFDDE